MHFRSVRQHREPRLGMPRDAAGTARSWVPSHLRAVRAREGIGICLLRGCSLRLDLFIVLLVLLHALGQPC
jgi:hypothetical protein